MAANVRQTMRFVQQGSQSRHSDCLGASKGGHHPARDSNGVGRWVYADLTVPQSLVRSFLSFLGLGFRSPDASLGTLIGEGVAKEAAARAWMLLNRRCGVLLLLFCLFGTACGAHSDVRKLKWSGLEHRRVQIQFACGGPIEAVDGVCSHSASSAWGCRRMGRGRLDILG